MKRTVMATVLAVAMAGCSAGPPPAAPTAPPAAPPAASPEMSPEMSPEPAGRAQALPVYYVALTPAGPRLQREFHRITTTDPASDAVREMFDVPAADPDYLSGWPAGTGLRAPVMVGADAITVDLTTRATGAPTGPVPATMALQQLVFTVQGAAGSTRPVRLLVDGAAVERVLGSVPVAAPVPRGDIYAMRSLVQIDSPINGATMERDVVVTGEAAVFEASVHWEVRRGATVVRTGVTSTSEGQVFAPFSFTVTLEPGEYEVRISEDDPSDGEGRPVLTDTKSITVA
ncbi:Gmad2 immunoglobulin-like domain-containing protein [Pseudonocardia sp. 73-21]|uniref:Gmad2 immunoglobulin-like domain-containing protein n=1 Tax=Pseudonocardia sp. 73-21 TaxID=1895809 RepID=UPI0009691A28|nr:Gmad2 immunoglobulin-like domain-containing protein [Pseudonocardia sp. 73-21]OJY45434.1 MAG: hypothetical protein BGP03_05555 [Pseudonocardia sp. 73-21]